MWFISCSFYKYVIFQINQKYFCRMFSCEDNFRPISILPFPMMNLDDLGWLNMIHDAILLENLFRFKCFLSILHTRPFDASPRKGWDKSLINFTSPTTLPQQVYTRIQACHKNIPSQSFSWLARLRKITMLASVNLIPSYCLVSLLLVLLWSGQTGVPHWNTNTKVPSLWGKYFKILAPKF